jgi:NAD+ synthase
LGGQDELVFDGASFVMSSAGEVVVQLPAWQEDIVHTTWSLTQGIVSCISDYITPLEEGLAATYQAAMLGLRDYVRKNGFPSVLLGLSGGIDSAICAALAADALGPEHVHCIMLPSKFTSQESLDDAKECADLLGVKLDEVSIEDSVGVLEGSLSSMFGDMPNDITEENIQSRLRGTLLMALSNKFGSMVVTTGNKSEVSVGYATLYGDMNGGFNPIKDIYKTEIFALAAWRNSHFPVGALGQNGKVIPVSIIEKPPTAELRDNQKDEDSLPPYDALDDILSGLVEEELGFDEIVSRGHDPDTVKRIEHLLYISEYKRRQAAPGVKIGHRNFGRDRRYPITNGFRNARLKG